MGKFGERSDGLDRTHLAAQTDGDPSLQRDLLHLFAVQASELAPQISALAATDPVGAGELAHRIGGSARAIGAFELAEAAASLERALNTGGGSAELNSVAAALGKALAAIEAHLGTLHPRS